jgi:glycosyltransferase involved in cell wall biosynthesis
VPRDPLVARSVLGLAGLPTILATGTFWDRSEAEQLAEAFATVRRRCVVQLAIFGTGKHRTTVLRTAYALGVGCDVHMIRNCSEGWWPDIVAAADVVAPSHEPGPISLLDILSAGRPVVAPIDPATVRLVVPASAGLVYRRGDISGMAASLLRLMTNPGLRYRMACRALEVGRRDPLLMRLESSGDS